MRCKAGSMRLSIRKKIPLARGRPNMVGLLKTKATLIIL
jgi:hypothetical protein